MIYLFLILNNACEYIDCYWICFSLFMIECEMKKLQEAEKREFLNNILPK